MTDEDPFAGKGPEITVGPGIRVTFDKTLAPNVIRVGDEEFAVIIESDELPLERSA